MSPTARAKAYCKSKGWPCQVVEKYNMFAKVRQDLFGIIDVLALAGDQVLGIQATSRANHKARVDKVHDSEYLTPWLNTKSIMEIWSYDPKILKTKGGRRMLVTHMEKLPNGNIYECNREEIL